MSDDPAARAARVPTRSMGLKLLLVCGLALAMAIPALFVFGVLMERSGRAQEVTREIGQTMGGPQTFLGPVLAVPYLAPGKQIVDEKGKVTGRAPDERGVYVVFPEYADARVMAATQVRKRSLFKVPVYEADVAFTSGFDLSQPLVGVPEGARLDWTWAEILVGVSDPRGARSDIRLTAGGRTFNLAPSATVGEQPLNEEEDSPAAAAAQAAARAAGGAGKMRFFGTREVAQARPGQRFDVQAAMKVSGAQRLAVLANGKTTTVSGASDWNDPSFDGGYLPARKTIGERGFTANWSVPFVARGVPAAGTYGLLSDLGNTAMGVSFVQPANPYQSVGRALKYAPMFIGLVFLAYFVFETVSRRRMHAAQYVLVGLAQTIFYLLLLSIAEQLGFDVGFAIAASATVMLISVYAGWVFESARQGLMALAAFSALYGLIYVLLRLEDFALLVGATASFAAIAAVMYFTRRIDWYGVGAQVRGGGAAERA